MNTPRLLIAVAAVTLLAGCAASPAPTPTPQPSYVPWPSETPSPQSTITPGLSVVPGTRLTVGPTPGTVLGEGGTPVRFVPADATLSFKCRPLTAQERKQADASLSGGPFVSARPARAVDLPEEGFAVVAYWGRGEDGGARPWAFVTGGGRISDLYDPWRGTHTLAGVAFADGPKALETARECIGAGQ